MIWSGFDKPPTEGVEVGDYWRDSSGWYWRYTVGTDEGALFGRGRWVLQS